MTDYEQCFDELTADSIEFNVYANINDTIEMLMKLKKKLYSVDCKNILIYNEFQTEIWIIQDIIKKINHVLNVICKEDNVNDDDKNKPNKNKKKPNKNKSLNKNKSKLNKKGGGKR
jgi:hypothetical protein